MDSTVGIVLPAYRPDVEVLSTYVLALAESIEPATIRIELDDPAPGVADSLTDLPATVNLAAGRRGKGAAVTAGFEALETDVMVFLDADASTPIASAERVIAPVLAGRADLAVGSRRHPDAQVLTHQTFARRRMGDVFAWIARRLLPTDLYDYQCGAKALTRETWTLVRDHLYEPGFAWDLELVVMAAALGCRIEEVPIAWEDHPGSTVSPVGTTISLCRALFLVRQRVKRLDADRPRGTIAPGQEGSPALVDRERL